MSCFSKLVDVIGWLGEFETRFCGVEHGERREERAD